MESESGMSLLEILVGMIILGLVTGGIFTAFVFSRKVNFRSESELAGYNFLEGVVEQLRLSVGKNSPGGLSQLAPGVYVDRKLGTAPFKAPPGAVILDALNLPNDFQARYQTNPGTAGDFINHGDGVVMVVEDATQDLDGDGKMGKDFDGDGKTDLYRVRLYVKKTTPTSNP